MLLQVICAFWQGLLNKTPHSHVVRAEKKLRDDLEDRQVDKMLEDSFPASDPPSTY